MMFKLNFWHKKRAGRGGGGGGRGEFGKSEDQILN